MSETTGNQSGHSGQWPGRVLNSYLGHLNQQVLDTPTHFELPLAGQALEARRGRHCSPRWRWRVGAGAAGAAGGWPAGRPAGRPAGAAAAGAGRNGYP